MRLACSLGPAWAAMVSCASNSAAQVSARRAPPDLTCALFSLTFMALANSLNCPKRAADYTALDPRPECLNRVTSPIDDTRAGCWFAQIIAPRTASPVTACRRSRAYLVARCARHSAEQREPRAAAARRDGVGVPGGRHDA